MTVKQIVANNPNLTNSAVALVLNDKTAYRVDNTLHGYAYLMKVFGVSAVNTLAASIKAVLEPVDGLLKGGGIDFSDSNTQAQIDALATANVIDANTATALKAIGLKPVSPWELEHGDGTAATSDDVVAIRAQLVADEKADWYESRRAASALAFSQGKTKAEIAAIWTV